MDEQTKPKRGFASMTPERQRELASMGGRAVPAEKRSFKINNALAVHAGRKGGFAARKHPQFIRKREDPHALPED